MIKLDRRTRFLASLIKKCKIAADIGCDHGKVLMSLLKSECVQYGIFSDISDKCLEKSRQLSQKLGLFNKCKFIVSDGFKNFEKHKIDFAIISGMGGKLIFDIIKNKPDSIKVKNFVLQPNTDVIYLRSNLHNLGYKIIIDKTIKEGKKFYNVLLIEQGSQILSENELLFGVSNLKEMHEDFVLFLNERKEKLNKFAQLNIKKQIELKKIKIILKEK